MATSVLDAPTMVRLWELATGRLQNVPVYLVGEKLFIFIMISEQDAKFAVEVPEFVS